MSVKRVYGNYSDNALRQLVKNGSVSEQIDALCEASGNGNLRLMRALCQSGISPHVLDGLPERRPLFIASECRHFRRRLPLMTYLVKGGANIDLPDKHNKTLLQHAVLMLGQYHSTQLHISMLVDNGADVSSRDNDGSTPLHKASQEGKPEIVKLLIVKGADVRAKDNGGRTPLHEAIELVDEDIVRLLIDNGAQVCAKDNDGGTPLHKASQKGKPEIVKLLIVKGADVRAKDKGGRTPLHEAIQFVDEDIVRLLIDNGAQVCAKDNFGKTPLHVTPMISCQEVLDKDTKTCVYITIVKHLIDKGADICAKDNAGRTPLHEVTAAGCEDSVKHQMALDANCWDRWDNPFLCLEDVGYLAKEGFARLFAEEDFKFGRTKLMVNVLIDNGAEVCAKDNDNKTPLHEAARSCNDDIIKILIDSGAYVSARDTYGRTPLHEATRSCNSDIIRLLVDRGAAVGAKDNDGRTPLHEATRSCNKEIINMLIDRGANVSAE